MSSVTQLAQSSNAFGFDLYQLLRQEPGNLVMSPASLTLALTMTWGGARGETADQMRKVLHLEGTADEVFATAGRLASALQDPSHPLVLRIANQLFGARSYTLVPAFVERTRAAFGAAVEALDFVNGAEKARVQINQWVEDKTERRIQNLIPEGGIGSLTRLVVVNAIYFLGDWKDPFDLKATRPATFHLTASETKDVPTMHRTGELRIAQQDGVTAVEIPYKGLGMSMMILVPEEIEGLAAVESALDTDKLDALASAMRWQLVVLALPKFEVNPSKSLSLAEALAALGMPFAFDEGQADFSGIANPRDWRDGLYIAKVFHKGFVKVDEKGTEAAAATAVVMASRGAPPPRPREIKVDRPFLYLIRDNASGLVLFLGRVSDPSLR